MDDLNSLSLAALFERLVAGESLDRLLDLALDEDLGAAGDITSRSIIPAEMAGSARMVARQGGVVAGLAAPAAVLARFGARDAFSASVADGDHVEAGAVLGVIDAPLRVILKAERLILNLVGRLSGIATLSRAFVDAVAGTGAAICETRKTTPGLRRLEKYAARCGGATLHRIGLHDAALYKDNHLAHLPVDAWTEAISDAAREVRRRVGAEGLRFVEVEVDTLVQLERVLAIEGGLIDYVLLDNMPVEVLREAVRMRDQRRPGVLLEASGGIDLSNVREIAETGVERISVGAITHSAPGLDVGLDLGVGR